VHLILEILDSGLEEIVMPQHSTRRMMALAMGIGLSMAWAGAAQAAGFNSGSTGADGALNVTTNTTLVMPVSGVFNFTTVTIASGATLSFKKNVANTPVVLLATGNVSIVGTIDVSGGNSAGNTPGTIGDTSLPGAGGPGGFDGGRGGVPANSRRAGNGLGPGGGGGGNGVANCCTTVKNYGQGGGGGGHANAGTGGYFAANNTDSATVNTGNAGPAYGSNLLIPLVGGSGGGGGGGSASTTGAYGTGGGGGGGAILIASSGAVTIAGAIKVTGGNSGATSSCSAATTCGASGGGGSGGAVRILASAISGAGSVNVAGGAAGSSPDSWLNGGAGSIGRVRYDVMSAGTLTLSGLPTLTITSVAGIAAPATPTGLQDIVLPENTPNPVAVTLAPTGVPAGNVVTLTLTPKRGAATTATSSALAGSTAGATATASIDVPTDISTLSAAVTYTVTVAMGEALSNFAQNERVEKIQLSATLGGKPRATLVTASGKEYDAPPAALMMAGIAP
jgi:hypothetical protein